MQQSMYACSSYAGMDNVLYSFHTSTGTHIINVIPPRRTSTISGLLSSEASATAVDSRVDRDVSLGWVRITNLLLQL